MNSADRNDHARRATEDAYARQERRDNFFRCGGYDHLPPIISPRPVTVPITFLSEQAIAECRRASK